MSKDLKNCINFLKISNLLFCDINKTTWANAKGFVFDENEFTLHFPAQNKDLKDKDLKEFQVRIRGSNFRDMILTGVLSIATSDVDIKKSFQLLVNQRLAGWDEEKATDALFNSRTNNPRKNRFKLKMEKIMFVDPSFYGDKEFHEVKLK